jgi:hypothetical protein
MVVEYPQDEKTVRVVYEMLAWRWNPEARTCEYLDVTGFVWYGKSGRKIGVVRVAENGA